MDGDRWQGIAERLVDAGIESLVFWLAVLAMLIAASTYAITKARRQSAQHERTTSQMLSKLRESHSRGELSDAEFRTIKTTLAAQLQDELKDDDQTA